MVMADTNMQIWLFITVSLFLLGLWVYNDSSVSQRALQLLLDGARTLNRQPWILVVFFVGCFVTVVIGEVNRDVSEWLYYARRFPGLRPPELGEGFAMAPLLAAARRDAIHRLAEIVIASPVSSSNSWLIVIVWICFRREINRCVLAGEPNQTQVQRIGSWLIWPGAFAAVSMAGMSVAIVATAFEKLSMHVGDVLRTRQFVQVIHVLGADE